MISLRALERITRPHRTGRRRWHLERYPRGGQMRDGTRTPWLFVAPLTWSNDPDRVVGVEFGGPRRCLAVLRLDTPPAHP